MNQLELVHHLIFRGKHTAPILRSHSDPTLSHINMLDTWTVCLVMFLNKITEAVRCESCYNYNGQACISNSDCYGNFCLFEQIQRPNGVISVRKACLNYGEYQFDDGMVITNLNQCVARRLNTGIFYVLICASEDNCNRNCITTATTTSQPQPGTVSCYDCITYDGTDCQTNVCNAKYCTYERKISNNQMMLKKGCTDVPLLFLDDGTAVDVVGICEIRNTVTTSNYVKLCNDANFCNNYCNTEFTIEPLQPTVEPPQRQPMVACYECESFGAECFTGQCTAQYCLYQRQRRRSTGTTYVKKSCTNIPFVEYPDNRPSSALNTCEYRTIDDIQYEVKVCNTGNNCNIACPAQDAGQVISCYQCEATNQADCTSGSCQGRYCLFMRTQTSIGMTVKKSCSNTNELLYPDGGRYASFGICEYRQINSVNYDYKLCNTSSFCNTPCPAGPFVTTTFAPSSSAHCVSFLLSTLTILMSLFVQ